MKRFIYKFYLSFIMKSVISHRIIKNDLSPIDKFALQEDGYIVQRINDAWDLLVFKEVGLPDRIGQEGLDSLTEVIRKSFDYLNEIQIEGDSAHGLIRKSSRGRFEKKYNGFASGILSILGLNKEIEKGYVLELTDEGPILYNLGLMDKVPILAGYGSLLDPEQLAANTELGDLRNSKDSDVRRRLSEEKDVLNKVQYGEVQGYNLRFNRAPTAKRHGLTQQERNKWSVLNLEKNENGKAYMMFFDPVDFTDNPLMYFAIENFDEIEYARRKINFNDINLLGDKKLKADYVWVLDSPLITDVIDNGQKKGTINSISGPRSIDYSNAEIKDNYIGMVTNGLAGAHKVSPDFVNSYIENTLQSNGKPLKDHQRFIGTLNSKILLNK